MVPEVGEQLPAVLDVALDRHAKGRISGREVRSPNGIHDGCTDHERRLLVAALASEHSSTQFSLELRSPVVQIPNDIQLARLVSSFVRDGSGQGWIG